MELSAMAAPAIIGLEKIGEPIKYSLPFAFDNYRGLLISLVSLDPRARNLLCKMSGFEPFEPFICQTTWKEENIIEGTANADGTYTYLLTHTNFDICRNFPIFASEGFRE